MTIQQNHYSCGFCKRLATT